MQDHNDELDDTIAVLLREVRDARPGALEDLFNRVYPDLKRLAQHILARRDRGRRVSATTLVHDACTRLLRADQIRAEDRRQFFGLFCRAMENEWADRARRALAQKRGGGQAHVPLDEAIDDPTDARTDRLDLHDALREFGTHDPEAAEVVRLRYFCGATLEQTAELMNLPVATVRRNWTYAKSWLHERLSRSDDGAAGADAITRELTDLDQN